MSLESEYVELKKATDECKDLIQEAIAALFTEHIMRTSQIELKDKPEFTESGFEYVDPIKHKDYETFCSDLINKLRTKLKIPVCRCRDCRVVCSKWQRGLRNSRGDCMWYHRKRWKFWRPK